MVLSTPIGYIYMIEKCLLLLLSPTLAIGGVEGEGFAEGVEGKFDTVAAIVVEFEVLANLHLCEALVLVILKIGQDEDDVLPKDDSGIGANVLRPLHDEGHKGAGREGAGGGGDVGVAHTPMLSH